jgi:hypothetical protein
VLRPGSGFFFADLRSVAGANMLRKQFNACGLRVEKEADNQRLVTNVLSLRLDSAQNWDLSTP